MAGTRPDLFGPALHAHMKKAARGFTRVSMFGEELPNPENRIELVSEKDEFGYPLGRLTHAFDDTVKTRRIMTLGSNKFNSLILSHFQFDPGVTIGAGGDSIGMPFA